MSFVDEILSISVDKRDSAYRHAVPNLELSVERCTSQVPGDGRFYVVHKGQVLKSYDAMAEAEARFRQIVTECHYQLKSLTLKIRHPEDLNVDDYFRRASQFP